MQRVWWEEDNITFYDIFVVYRYQRKSDLKLQDRFWS